MFIKVGTDVNSIFMWSWFWDNLLTLHHLILCFQHLLTCYVTMPSIKSWSVKCLHRWAALKMLGTTIKTMWMPMWIAAWICKLFWELTLDYKVFAGDTVTVKLVGFILEPELFYSHHWSYFHIAVMWTERA